MRTLPIVESFAKCTVVNLNMPNNVSTAVQYSHNIPKNKYECFGRLGDNKWKLKENDLNVYFQKIVLFCNKGLLSSCTHSTHANSLSDYPGVSWIQTKSPALPYGHKISRTIQIKAHKIHFSDIIILANFGILEGKCFGYLMHF